MATNYYTYDNTETLETRVAKNKLNIEKLVSVTATTDSNLSSETSRATSSEETLQSNIDNEASARSSADSSLGTRIDNEASTRSSAISDLQSKIDAINSSQNFADTVATFADLSNLSTTNYDKSDCVLVLNDEKNSNQSAVYKWSGTAWELVGTLGTSYTKAEVDTMLATRDTNIASANTAISTETSRATAAEGALQDSIDALTSGSGVVKEAAKVTHALTVGSKSYNGSADVSITKSDLSLGNVANARQVEKSGTSTASHVAIWADTGYALKDSGYTIASSVPSGAKFTDTTYSAGTGITISSAQVVSFADFAPDWSALETAIKGA